MKASFDKSLEQYFEEHPLPELHEPEQESGGYFLEELLNKLKRLKIDYSKRTLVYHTQHGLVSPPLNSGKGSGKGGRARYTDKHLRQIMTVRALQAEGLSLDEIRREIGVLLTADKTSQVDSKLIEYFKGVARLFFADLSTGLQQPGFDPTEYFSLHKVSGVNSEALESALGGFDLITEEQKAKVGPHAFEMIFEGLIDLGLEALYFQYVSGRDLGLKATFATLALPEARMLLCTIYGRLVFNACYIAKQIKEVENAD